MNTEQKVTSLELSKQLKEAGAKQESQWWWIEYDDVSGSSPPFCLLVPCEGISGKWNAPPRKESAELRRWSTFDCAELLERLPKAVTVEVLPTKTMYYHLNLAPGGDDWSAWYDHDSKSDTLWGTHGNTPAEALGKLYLWCLKEGHCKE